MFSSIRLTELYLPFCDLQACTWCQHKLPWNNHLFSEHGSKAADHILFNLQFLVEHTRIYISDSSTKYFPHNLIDLMIRTLDHFSGCINQSSTRAANP